MWWLNWPVHWEQCIFHVLCWNLVNKCGQRVRWNLVTGHLGPKDVGNVVGNKLRHFGMRPAVKHSKQRFAVTAKLQLLDHWYAQSAYSDSTCSLRQCYQQNFCINKHSSLYSDYIWKLNTTITKNQSSHIDLHTHASNVFDNHVTLICDPLIPGSMHAKTLLCNVGRSFHK